MLVNNDVQRQVVSLVWQRCTKEGAIKNLTLITLSTSGIISKSCNIQIQQEIM